MMMRCCRHISKLSLQVSLSSSSTVKMTIITMAKSSYSSSSLLLFRRSLLSTTTATNRLTATATTKTTIISTSPMLQLQLGNNNNINTKMLFSTTTNNYTTINDNDPNRILQLPKQYLREMDVSNFDTITYQRNNVLYDIHNGKPIITSKNSNNKYDINECNILLDDNDNQYYYQIKWNDEHVSKYSIQWVEDQIEKWKGVQQSTTTTESSDDTTKRVLWTNLTEDKVRTSSTLCIDFNKALTKEGMDKTIVTLYKYGILLVTNTPIHDSGAGVAALASSLGGGSNKNSTSILQHYLNNNNDQLNNEPIISLPHGTDGPLRTLYGTVWSTTSSGQVDGASVADSAYGHSSLPLHTDMTYMLNPPGLQIFTMIQPAKVGGESIFGDGYAAAEILRTENPYAFHILSNTVRRYHCIDKETGWYLQANGPIINIDPYNKYDIVQIRHNDLDRLPDLPPLDVIDDDIDNYYKELHEAHVAWDKILQQDDIRLIMNLQPGDTMVVANQRCFHGRFAFEASTDSPRSVMGCYMGQDELSSRFRMLGLDCYC